MGRRAGRRLPHGGEVPRKPRTETSLVLQNLAKPETAAWVQVGARCRQAPQGLPSALSEPADLRVSWLTQGQARVLSPLSSEPFPLRCFPSRADAARRARGSPDEPAAAPAPWEGLGALEAAGSRGAACAGRVQPRRGAGTRRWERHGAPGLGGREGRGGGGGKGKRRLLWGTTVEMRAVGCGAAPVGKGCVEEEGGIRGETEWGVPGGGPISKPREEGGCLVGQKAEGERTGCMDRWMVGFKLFHLAYENVWCCKNCSLFAQ